MPSLRGEYLVERVARLIGFTIRPQHRKQLVAAHTFFSGNSEHGEERKSPALGGRTSQRRPTLLKCESAKRGDPESRFQMRIR